MNYDLSKIETSVCYLAQEIILAQAEARRRGASGYENLTPERKNAIQTKMLQIRLTAVKNRIPEEEIWDMMLSMLDEWQRQDFWEALEAAAQRHQRLKEELARATNH